MCWPYGTYYVFTENVENPNELAKTSIKAIDAAESASLIDSTSNLKDNAVYIWSGLKDEVTRPEG